MTQEMIAKYWLATKGELEDVLLHEQLVQCFEPTKDVCIAHETISELYCRYVQLCRMLNRCYDQTLQVQKRDVVTTLAEAANRRLLELQQKIKQMELSEFTYIDGVLRQFRLIPQDVQLFRPCYFPIERPDEYNKLISSRSLQSLTSGSDNELSSSSESEEEPPPDPRRPYVKRDRAKEKRVAALGIILAHEKARQARIMQFNFQAHPKIFYPKPREDTLLDFHYEFYHRPDQIMLFPIKRTVFKWDYRLKQRDVIEYPYYRPPGWVDEKREVKKKQAEQNRAEEQRPAPELVTVEVEVEEENIDEKIEIMTRNRSARRIQRYWRRYQERKRLIRERYNKNVFLGMVDAMERGPDLCSRIDQAERKRRKRKPEFDEAFLLALDDEKARILQKHGPWIMEDISDHIRAWFREFYDRAHAFDRYPEAWEGGTLLVIRGETMTPEEYLEAQKQKALNKKKSTEQKKREAEARKQQKELEREKQKEKKQRLRELKREEKEREKKEGKTYDFRKPEFATKNLLTIEETLSRYEKDWYFVEELANKDELPIMEWITLDKFAEVHQELRPLVDEVLRLERELLQKALCKDSKKKYKPPKPKKQKRKKGKGKGKKKNKKEAADLTADRTIDSLYEELVKNGIIRTYKKRKIDDFIGDYNYAAFEKRNYLEQDPPAAMGEIRDIIKSWLFGMGSLNLPKPKSFCLIAPPGYGKTLLVEAVCTETDSVLFDLSSSTIAPIDSTALPMLLHVVLKLARLFQPSVVCIDSAHKLFYKKVPVAEADMDPTKLGKILFKKFVKQIKKDDRILLVGTTNQPWTAKAGKFKKCFEKFLIIPKTDYGTTQLLWRHALSKKVGIGKDFDVSPLSMITKGYSPQQIVGCVNQVLGIRRRMRLAQEPLTAEELIEHFLQKQPAEYPITDKEYTKYMKFYKRMDKLAKRRAKMVKAREEMLAKLKTKEDKKKK
ncbi:IQ and AAA domain-containing protein 1-like [Toxorhynchites rutilus septentrionalis]|uniref:IQ and AAA domain-containing protein 1-like n=1 Tax=Toxorhynchites rutilus septentrionalis TaxID=329112 RepID=UPI00247934D9|nr:IQ and AAA domain-containing protein 1-like [Toxorhynchites rutilus septentrionalis]